MGGPCQVFEQVTLKVGSLYEGEEVLGLDVEVELGRRWKARTLVGRLARQLGGGDDGLKRAGAMAERGGLQEAAEDSAVDAELLPVEEVRGTAMQDRAQQDGSADHVVRIVLTLGVRTQHVHETLEPADEVGSLGLPKSGVVRVGARALDQVLSEVLHAGAGAAGEHKDRRTDGVGELTLAELAVLHRRQEVTQPPERPTVEGCIELVPEHQRDLAGQRRIPNEMEGVGELVGRAELGQVEFEGLAHAVTGDRVRHLLHAEGLAGSGRSEDADRERLGRRVRGVVGNEREATPRNASISLRSAVTRLANRPRGTPSSARSAPSRTISAAISARSPVQRSCRIVQ